VNIKTLLDCLKGAVRHALETGDWSEWKAIQDRHLTDDLMQHMTDAQRIRLHELTHGFILVADPDGTWSDQLSDRLEREFRASLERDAAQARVRTAS